MTRHLVVFALGLAALINQPGIPAAQATPLLMPGAATVVRIVKVDVDGDGHKDRVEVSLVSPTSATVSVTTAKKKTATITLALSDDPYPIDNPWYAAARLDGGKGAELILQVFSGDGQGFRVLRWSRGKLVMEKPAAAPSGSSWYLLGQGYSGQGYHFFTARKHRYVDAGEWNCTSSEGKNCSAKVFRSIWRSGAWHKTRTLTERHRTMAQIKKYWDFTGVKLIR